MLLDTHLHTREGSPDSELPVREAIARAKAMGLGGLCVTDHDSWAMMHEAEALSREHGLPIFVGVEVLTSSGDFVVFGVGPFAYEPGRLRAEDLMERTRACGGVAVAAHPYRDNGRGAGKLIETLPGLAGVECFNGSTDLLSNLRALRGARERGLACLGASDAHLVERVGLFATRFEGEPRDVRELIDRIRAGACAPVAWDGATFVPAEAWTERQLERTRGT